MFGQTHKDVCINPQCRTKSTPMIEQTDQGDEPNSHRRLNKPTVTDQIHMDGWTTPQWLTKSTPTAEQTHSDGPNPHRRLNNPTVTKFTPTAEQTLDDWKRFEKHCTESLGMAGAAIVYRYNYRHSPHTRNVALQPADNIVCLSWFGSDMMTAPAMPDEEINVCVTRAIHG